MAEPTTPAERKELFKVGIPLALALIVATVLSVAAWGGAGMLIAAFGGLLLGGFLDRRLRQLRGG